MVFVQKIRELITPRRVRSELCYQRGELCFGQSGHFLTLTAVFSQKLPRDSL
jgi:hypothetical protein